MKFIFKGDTIVISIYQLCIYSAVMQKFVGEDGICVLNNMLTLDIKYTFKDRISLEFMASDFNMGIPEIAHFGFRFTTEENANKFKQAVDFAHNLFMSTDPLKRIESVVTNAF